MQPRGFPRQPRHPEGLEQGLLFSKEAAAWTKLIPTAKAGFFFFLKTPFSSTSNPTPRKVQAVPELPATIQEGFDCREGQKNQNQPKNQQKAPFSNRDYFHFKVTGSEQHREKAKKRKNSFFFFKCKHSLHKVQGLGCLYRNMEKFGKEISRARNAAAPSISEASQTWRNVQHSLCQHLHSKNASRAPRLKASHHCNKEYFCIFNTFKKKNYIIY